MTDRLNFTKKALDSLYFTLHDLRRTFVERLREPMQEIAGFILKAAGVKPTAAVVTLRQER